MKKQLHSVGSGNEEVNGPKEETRCVLAIRQAVIPIWAKQARQSRKAGWEVRFREVDPILLKKPISQFNEYHSEKVVKRSGLFLLL